MNTLNLKMAIRNLFRNKLYTILSIGGFTFSFTIFLLICIYLIQENTVDKSFPGSEKIFRVIGKGNNSNLNYDLSNYLSFNYPEIEFSSPAYLVHGMDLPVKSGEKSARLNGMASVTNDFFKIFSLKPIKMVSDEPFSDIGSAVITRSMSEKLFGENDPLGKEIQISDFFIASISAVIEDLPVNISMEPAIFLNSENEKYRFSRYCHNGDCIYLSNHFLILKEGTDLKKFSEKLKMPDFPGYENDTLSVQKLTDIYFAENVEGNRNKTGNRKLVNIFLGIALLVLILSVINHLNFSLSSQIQRCKSSGVCLIFGAAKRQLFKYYIIEISIIIIISVVLALDLAHLFLGRMSMLLNTTLDHKIISLPAMIMIVMLVPFFIIMINSIVPVSVISRFKAGQYFNGVIPFSNKKYLNSYLNIFQFMVTTILIACFLIMYDR